MLFLNPYLCPYGLMVRGICCSSLAIWNWRYVPCFCRMTAVNVNLLVDTIHRGISLENLNSHGSHSQRKSEFSYVIA